MTSSYILCKVKFRKIQKGYRRFYYIFVIQRENKFFPIIRKLFGNFLASFKFTISKNKF